VERANAMVPRRLMVLNEQADVAMTYVFGGFSGDFYDGKLCRENSRVYFFLLCCSVRLKYFLLLFAGYESEWPLPEVII